jgi:hypothetical protein
VAPGSAARTASSSVGTSRTSTPLGRSTSSAMVRIPGYASDGATSTSPVWSIRMTTALTAAIPAAKTTL